ncbi:hypothetical protein [Gorillibacterium sp. CAU 1737]|uniref:DUF7408 domain-containing protein n=1 Tax=Gorillibacterium sp. CAU 1737 TaxID=3140362 RepID=UPI003260A068
MLTKLRTVAVRIAIALLCVGVIGSAWDGPLAASLAHAEDAKLETRIIEGYESQGQAGTRVPIRIILTNPGEDLAGTLVVTTVNPAGGKDISYNQEVELAKGSTKTLWFSVPAFSYSSKNSKIEFRNKENGKTVELSGQKYLKLNMIDEQIIGGLTRDPDTLNFLSAIRLPSLLSIPLTPDDIPDDPGYLTGLKALVVNDFASDSLRPEQVEAIRSWVKTGGKLFLAGGAQYAKSAKPFADLAPLAATGTTQLTEMPNYAQFGGKELTLSSPLTLATGSLTDGVSVATESGVPIISTRNVGLGRVYSFAYDLADSAISGWSGNAGVWPAFFDTPANRNGGPLIYSNSFWQIDNALNQFPSLNSPKLGLLGLLFAGYVLLVAPLLYLLLKKLDRREWAWGIIPLFAILSTGIIYYVGASDKTSSLVHELNRFELDGSGSGKRISDAAVFVSKGGKFSLDLPASAQAMPFGSEMGSGVNAQLAGTTEASLHQLPDSLRVEWSNVDFWSVRKTHWENPREEKLGQFQVKARYEGTDIIGEVTNETEQPLTDVHVVSSGNLISVGDLAKGETKTFRGSVTNTTPYIGDIGYNMFNHSTPSYERQMQMISSYFTEMDISKRSDTWVVGWSKDKEPDFKAKGVSRFDRLNLWVQKVAVEKEQQGKLTYPTGVIPAQLSSSTAGIQYGDPGYMQVSSGTLEFEYRIPPTQKTYRYHDLTISQTEPVTSVQLEILNAKTTLWEPLPVSNSQHVIKGDISEYVNASQVIRMKATISGETGFWLPLISLEGTVAP